MKNVLAWHAHPWPVGKRFGAGDLCDPTLVAELLSLAQIGAARITAEGWQFLWQSYGLDGLLVVARQVAGASISNDERLTEFLIRQSMIAGYDPVSGFFGTYRETSNEFELAGK